MTPQETLFATAYLKHFNAARAAREAGYSARSSHRQGWELLRRPEIKQAVEEGIAARLERTQIDADFVLREWAAIALADVSEIMQHRRCCCRYCYGVDGKYQRTQNERDADFKHFQTTPQALAGEDFDEKGGVGYNPLLDPSPECMECFGEGEARLYVADTRDMSPGARALFAGIKQTKEGLEVKFHSKDKALEMIARHLGMLKDKIEIEGTLGIAERLARARRRTSTPEDDGSDLAG